MAGSLASVLGAAESLEEEGEGKADSLPAAPVVEGASSGSAGITWMAGRRGKKKYVCVCVWCVVCVCVVPFNIANKVGNSQKTVTLKTFCSYRGKKGVFYVNNYSQRTRNYCCCQWSKGHSAYLLVSWKERCFSRHSQTSA